MSARVTVRMRGSVRVRITVSNVGLGLASKLRVDLTGLKIEIEK